MKLIELENIILKKYLKHLVTLDSFLSKIQMGPKIHTGGNRYQEGNKELITPPVRKDISFDLNLKDVKDYTIENFICIIDNYAQEYINNMFKMIFGLADDITQLTGNIVDAKNTKFNIDMYLDGLEKIEINFDKDGNPIIPTLICNPKLLKQIMDTRISEEQKERQNKILAEKKKMYYDKKRYRRLSYIN